MQKMTYSEQLRHPNWQRKRLAMLDSADWTCEKCDAKETTLHVHHKQYIKGRMAWEYEPHELLVLCEECHEDEHFLQDELKTLLSQVDTSQALGVLRGFYATANWIDFWFADSGRDREPDAYLCGFVAFLCQSLTKDQKLSLGRFLDCLLDEHSEERMHLLDMKHLFFGDK